MNHLSVGAVSAICVSWEKQKGNMTRLRALIDWAHKNKLSFHVTEMNVWLKSRDKNFNAQAETFTAVMRALLERRDSGVVTWNVWNISDRDHWRKEKYWEPCLFDRQYRAKPAYYALQKLLENPPQTKQRNSCPPNSFTKTEALKEELCGHSLLTRTESPLWLRPKAALGDCALSCAFAVRKYMDKVLSTTEAQAHARCAPSNRLRPMIPCRLPLSSWLRE